MSLLLLLLAHLAAGVVGVVGFEERSIFVTYPKLSLSQQLLTTAPRGAGSECFSWLWDRSRRAFADCLLYQKQVLPSDSPAEHGGGFASCKCPWEVEWSRKMVLWWLLHRLLLASPDYALRFYFCHYFVKPAENSLFPLFPRVSLSTYCVKSMNP